MSTALAIERALKKLGSKEKAEHSARFFKTGKGQYGEGDVFLGVTVPEQRRLAKMYGGLSFAELKKLLESKIHECRLTALIILVEQYKRAKEKGRSSIAKFYLAHTKRINNWDLVDASASHILGTHLLHGARDTLYKLARSKNMWERRIAIVATHAFIRKDDFADTLNLSGLLFRDQEDLMHKAVGWMLREVGKRSRSTLASFLKEHAPEMPRTALRYALEHFSPDERKKFMQMK
jgi:3-methyladenine DNA glycosylase AlkD